MRKLFFLLVFCLIAPGAWAAPGGLTAKEDLLLRVPEVASNGPSSQYIECSISTSTGLFTFGVPGGPILLYGHPTPGTTWATVMVDGVAYIQGGWDSVSPVTTTGSRCEGVWKIGSTGVEIHQILTLVKGFNTDKEDTFLIQYLFRNTGTVARSVGVRMMFDTDLNDNDGAPFQVPGAGSVTTAKTWNSPAIPSYFFVFNDLTNPEVTCQGSLIGGSITVPADRFVIAPWGNALCPTDGLVEFPWEYATSDQIITCDSAYAVYWMPRTLAPGGYYLASTYYGLGGIDVDREAPLTSMSTAPVFLDCVENIITPNPFEIALYLENSAEGVSGTVTGITATLALPDGLRIAPGSETQIVADMESQSSHLLSWAAIADGSVRGDLPYTITVASSNHGQKVESRSISIPNDCETGDLPPIVAVTAPAAGAVVSCQATLKASTWDDRGIQWVQYYLDDAAIGSPVSTSPYPLDWDFNAVANGAHLIYAIARDTTGHESRSNKISISVEHAAITSVKYKAQKKQLWVEGDGLQDGYTLTVRGTAVQTVYKTKATDLFFSDFAVFPGKWASAGSVQGQEINSDGIGYAAYMEAPANIYRAVSTLGRRNIKVTFSYSYTMMDAGEGVVGEYSVSGSEGPWIMGFSDLSGHPDGGKAWRTGVFYCQAAAANNPNFAIRLRAVSSQSHKGPLGIAWVSNARVASVATYLVGKKVTSIGPAQTVAITVRYEGCETAPYLFTRP